jgi:hypothetical protein
MLTRPWLPLPRAAQPTCREPHTSQGSPDPRASPYSRQLKAPLDQTSHPAQWENKPHLLIRAVFCILIPTQCTGHLRPLARDVSLQREGES